MYIWIQNFVQIPGINLLSDYCYTLLLSYFTKITHHVILNYKVGHVVLIEMRANWSRHPCLYKNKKIKTIGLFVSVF